MECPHLDEHVKVGFNTLLNEKTELKCAVCSSDQQPWMCLYCGVVNCSRYVCGHALNHSESHSDHNVCMDCESYAVYCYTCDDYVVNDTKDGLLSRMKEMLIRVSPDSSPSISWDDGTSISPHNLRPRARKRSHSNDSSSTASGGNRSDSGSCERKKSKDKTKEDLSDCNVKKQKEKTKREKKVVGLRNLGNTCFMNAVLQSLSNIEEFCLYFKKLPSLESIKPQNGSRSTKVYQSCSLRELNEAIVAEELRKVLISLSDQSQKGAISPESLFLVIWKVVPRYRGYQQQDAHEFLRYMLDRLHTELLHLLPDFTLRDSLYISHKNKTSVVTSVFGGTLQSEVRCLNCGTESKKHDPFLDLSLDIPEKCQVVPQRHTRSQVAGLKETQPSDTPPCHIIDCLTSFIEVEELADTELYYCNNCKSKQKSTKRFWIRRLPNVLCLHLKRFRWNNFFRTKIDTEIAFPVIALDMSQFVLREARETRGTNCSTNLYDLAAVVVHHGGASGSGHYTAFAINDGQWFHFNDSMVRPTQIDVVAKCKPYIMFYIRREFKLPSVRTP